MRKGQEVMVTAEVGRLEDGEKLADSSAQPGQPGKAAPAVVTVLGMTLSSMTDELRSQFGIDKDLKGAVVTEVAQEGAAADKRLEPGDVITEAGEKEVQGAADVSARIDEAKKANKNSMLLLVAKGGKSARCASSHSRSSKGWLTPGTLAPIALEVEERGEIAVVDAEARRLLHLRLGVERHAHARLAQHGEVVGPVAHRECIRRGNAEPGGDALQRLELCLLAEDGIAHLAGRACRPRTISSLAWFSSKPRSPPRRVR